MMGQDKYEDLAARAESAVQGIKDPELRRVAFEKILDDLLGRGSAAAPGETRRATPEPSQRPATPKKTRETRQGTGQETAIDLAGIVSIVKNCDEAEAIERNILNRSSQVDRTLLPFYIAHEHLDNAFGLSSGDISKITTELGVPVSQPNASRTLSGTASKYVIGDRVRKKGQPVRYKLSRRGVLYMQAVIRGKADEKSG